MAVPEGPTQGWKRAQTTVLLVEDDARVRVVATEMLERLGYRVLTAADGPSALSILATEEAVDLLFTDYVLPKGLNGADLAERAQTLRPGLKVLHTSGYTQRHVFREGRLRACDPFIAKPYALAKLEDQIRKALDSVGE